MRIALAVIFLLTLCGPLRADDDDDAVPDNQAPAPGIPERIQELEREWAQDVGTKDPDDATEPSEEVTEPVDADDAPAHATKPAADDAPRPKPPSALSDPLGNHPSESPLKDPLGRGATDKKAAPPPPAPAPPPSDSATSPED